MKKHQGWKGFLHFCTTCTTEEDFNQLFELFATHEEREMFASRYNIIQALLEAQKAQREISSDLKVSIAQITRGSNELKKTSAKFKKKLSDYFLE